MEADIDFILNKYKHGKRDDLIPLLQEVQEHLGFLSEEAIVKIGSHLGLSTTKIFGLATFYDRFRFVTAGKLHLRVCNGTSCYLNGSQAVINRIKEETGLQPGATSRDGNFSYEIVTCMGGCHNGPLVEVNGEYHTRVVASRMPELLTKLRYVIEND